MYKPCNYAYLLETCKSCMEMRLGCLNGTRGAPHGCALFDILGSFGKVMGSLRHIAVLLYVFVSMCTCGWRQVAQRGHYAGKNEAQTPPLSLCICAPPTPPLLHLLLPPQIQSSLLPPLSFSLLVSACARSHP